MLPDDGVKPTFGPDPLRSIAIALPLQSSWLCRGNRAYVKKAPFRSRPNTEIRFRVGLGASDSNVKPCC